MKNCEENGGKEALQGHNDFTAGGSEDVSILWTGDELSEKEFYKIEDPRCSKNSIELSCPHWNFTRRVLRYHCLNECPVIQGTKDQLKNADNSDYK